MYSEKYVSKIYGRKHIKTLKKQNYLEYIKIRKNPAFVPSDIIKDALQFIPKELRVIIDDYMDELFADYYVIGLNWNGYQVFEPKYFKMTYIGYPLVVLVKGDEVRISTAEESLEYLDYSCKIYEERIKIQMEDIKSVLHIEKFIDGINWKTYNVYEMLYNEQTLIKTPLVVLEKDNNVRLANPKESCLYFKYKKRSIKKLLKQLEKIKQRLLYGNYDSKEEEIEKYNEIKSQLDNMGVVMLDDANFDNLIY